jgi:hypothetical protein
MDLKEAVLLPVGEDRLQKAPDARGRAANSFIVVSAFRHVVSA